MAISTPTAHFGCNQPKPTAVKTQLNSAQPHICQFSGCCAQFGAAQRVKMGMADISECKKGGFVDVLGTIVLVAAGLLVGRRLLKTVFGTVSTTLRDFGSRLFRGHGIVDLARGKGQVQGYVQGAKDGMTVSKNYFIREIWNPFVAHLRYGVDVTAAKINAS